MIRSLCAATAALVWSATTIAAPQTFTVVDESGQALAGAAVSVAVKGTPATTSGKTVDMAQRDKQFAPRLVVIQTGTAVNFPNFDTVRHHVYSFSNTKPFEIKLYTGRPSAPVTFDKPGTATLGCNIHDNMLGHIHVVDTPYFGVTNGQGKVDIDVPGGDHRVRVWHPKMGENMAGQDFRMVLGSGPLHLRLLP